MKLDLVFKDVRPAEALADRIESKFDKIEKILRRSPPLHVTVSKTKAAYRCVTRFNHKGKEFVAEGRGEDLFVASDEAIHKLETQVTKTHARQNVRRPNGASPREVVEEL